MTRPPSTIVVPYGATLYYARNLTEWQALSRKFGDALPDTPDSVGRTDEVLDSVTGKRHIVVWTDPEVHKGNPAELVTSLAHEAYHVASDLLYSLGHRPQGTDEPTAYLLEWVLAWLMEHTLEDT